MGAIGETELKKQISSGNISSVYLFYGEESYLKQHYVNVIRKKLVHSGMEDFNLHMFEGKSAAFSEIIEAANLLPTMGARSCIIAHDFPLDTLTDRQKKELKEFMSDAPEESVLIFWMDNINVDIKVSKWKTIVANFTKLADSVNLCKRSSSSLCKLLCDGAAKRDCKMSRFTAEYALGQIGSDLQTLLGELEKLCSFAQGEEITKEIVDKVAVKCLNARVFDLSKALVRGDSDSAYSILNNLITLKEEPIAILAVMSSAYVDMYRVKCAKISGKQALDVAKHYNYHGKEFRLQNASRDCDKLTVQMLRSSVNLLSDADIALKSTSTDGKLILEEAMVKLLLVAKGTLK